MILDLDNIGGIRLIPHGGSTPVTYGWGTFHRNVSAGQYSGSFTIKKPSDPTTDVGYKTGMMMPGFRDTSKPLLDIDGKVYIPDVSILSGYDEGLESWNHGGYLGTKTHTLSFRDGQGTRDTFTFDTLAVIPSQYDGGLVVSTVLSPGPGGSPGEGIFITSDVMNNALQSMFEPSIPGDLTFGHVNWSDSFSANSEKFGFINFVTFGPTSSSTVMFTWDGMIQGAVGYWFSLKGIERIYQWQVA